MKLNKIVAVVASAAMASFMVPAAALASTPTLLSANATAYATGATYTNVYGYSIYAQRDAQYGTPPNGDSSNNGMSFVIELSMANGVKINDAAAAIKSIAAEGNFLLNGSAINTISNASISTDGQVIKIQVPVAMAIMGGVFKSPGFVLDGVTVDGEGVKFPEMNTVICTGLKFHTSSVTVGTLTTPASTTITVDKSAVVRSMNHVVWTSNGTSIIDDTGTAQTTAAHHHTFYNFTTETSAQSIQSNAVSNETLAANYDITTTGNTVTITAKTAKKGERLGVYNYDDAFLQNAGLAFTDKVTDLENPEVGMFEAGVAFDQLTWSGKAKKPSVYATELNYSGYGSLTKGVDYKVTYKNNVKCGKATAIITGLGIYAAQDPVKVTFKIVPKTAKIKLTGGKKYIRVKWAKTGATKYKVSWRVKGTKKWSSGTCKYTDAKISPLKSGKKYQVKVTSIATGVSSTTSAIKTVKVK